MANSSRHSGTVPHVDYIKNLAEFYSLIASTSSKPMIVDFTATWCPPCKRIGPIFVAMSGEAENAGWTFRKVDVDEANDVAQVAKINCMPTFKVYKNGAEVAELEGANEQGIRSLLAQWKNKSAANSSLTDSKYIGPNKVITGQNKPVQNLLPGVGTRPSGNRQHPPV